MQRVRSEMLRKTVQKKIKIKINVPYVISLLCAFSVWSIIIITISAISLKGINNENTPVTAKIPSILWLSRPGRDFRYTRKETIQCPVSKNKSVTCRVYCRWEDHPCNIDAYLSFAGFMHAFPLYRKPHQLWAFLHEESPRLNPIFLSKKLLALFNFSATFSRNSDIPFPLQFFGPLNTDYGSHPHNKNNSASLMIKGITSTMYFVNTTTKNSYLREISPLLYLQSNRDTFIDRDKYVLKLMDYISVDSYGNSSINNRKLPEEFPRNSLYNHRFIKFTSRYKFQISIENAACKDYMTEKLWKPIRQGIVPIYFGSPTVRDWLPNKKSAILIEDYASPEMLAQYLHELLKNDSKYEEHLEHKTKKLITNQNLINELTARPYQVSINMNIEKLKCLVCLKLHEGNNSRINTVSRKALECEMPLSLLSNAPDPNNIYTAEIKKAADEADVIYDKYSKQIPLESENGKFSLVPAQMKFMPGSPYGRSRKWAPDCRVNWTD